MAQRKDSRGRFATGEELEDPVPMIPVMVRMPLDLHRQIISFAKHKGNKSHTIRMLLRKALREGS